MSSRASRPRSASSRSRRQRLAAGAVLATTSLLGTYLAAIRPQPTYAAPNTGSQVGQGLVGPTNSGLCAIADDTTVYDDTSLRTAITQSNDDSVICIGASFSVSSQISIDDTALTIVGRDDSAVVLTSDGRDRFFDVTFDSPGDGKSVAFRNFTLISSYYAPGVTGDGGAIDVQHSTASTYDDTVILSDMTFIGNRASVDGGAVYVTDLASFQVTTSIFGYNGTGTDDGGAIYVKRTTAFTVDSSSFGPNAAASSGGAIFVESADEVVISGSTFVYNIAPGADGGAIDLESGVTSATLTDDTFTSNYANDDGGAVWNAATNLTISGTTFTGNYVIGSNNEYGGALWTNGNTVIDNAYFRGNRAEEGGAVRARANIEVRNSTFEANLSLAAGGAMKSDRLTTVTSSTFRNNRAGSGADGGALWAESLVLEGSYLGNNYAPRYGGGAFVAGYTTIESSSFFRNDAGDLGAGAYVDGDSSAVSTVTGSSFIGNGDDTAPQKGGGLYFWDNGPLDITNSTFSENKAQQGGGIYIAVNNNYDDTISYTTIASNTATGGSSPPSSGGGIFADDTVTLLNSIVSGNSATLFFDARLNPNYGNIQNNVFSSAGATNNAGTAPAFGVPLLGTLGDNGGPLVGDDSAYYLPTAIPAWNSPAVGLADPTLTPSITTTQIGTARVGNVAGSVNAAAAPTPPTPPTPTPVFPPPAPLNITGTAGDASATITWTAPASAGSFPITDYQAVLSPGGATCLVQAPASSCTITGLTNGTPYTATARALNGAGWGTLSTPSEPFTPENPTPPPVTKTIVITGTRGTVDGRPGVYANGETTGLVGATVQARVKLAGQTDYADGSTRIVQPDGTFQWQRKTGKKVYVYFIADNGEVRSNRVIIPAR